MLPRALLFSSDEQTSTVLRQVLSDLGLEVSHCREIFAAVEELTRRNFQTILIDWTQELEASFLFNMTRELKSTRNTYCVVIVDAALAASLTVSPNAFLARPFTAEQVRQTLSQSPDLKTQVPNTADSVSSGLALLPRTKRAEDVPRTFGLSDGVAAASKRMEPYPIPNAEALHEKIRRVSLASEQEPALVRHGATAGKKTLALFCLLTLLAAVVHGEQQLGYLPGGLATYRDFLLSPNDKPANADDQNLDSFTWGIIDEVNSHSHSARNNYLRKLSGQVAVHPVSRDGYSNQPEATLNIPEVKTPGSIVAPTKTAEPTGSNPLIPPSLHLSPARIPMFQNVLRPAFTPANWPAGAISVP